MTDTTEKRNQQRAAAGTFIVLEGTDGSGKSTQFALLKERLERAGCDVMTLKFPRYDEASSYFIRGYLSGVYGDASSVGPYAASLFYALDRYQASGAIRDALAAGKVVLCDRFTGSNMAHQGGKLTDARQRRDYFHWVNAIEYEMLDIPRPARTFVLHTPADVAMRRLRAKARSSTHIAKDIHEADEAHIRSAAATYEDLCELFPEDFTRVAATRSGKLLGIDEVSELLWKEVEPLLPSPATKAPAASAAQVTAVAAVQTDNPYITRTKQGIQITEAGYEYLSKAVTDPKGNVYAFTSMFSPVTIAAAMARLSRRGDDMRVTILDEFAATLGKDQKLLQRVITAYGDDSVQQLAGIHFVVENATKLMSNILEWGRLAAYLEQSTRYIYFDKKTAAGKYRYHVPESLKPDVRKAYVTAMDHIFDLYSDMVHKLTDYVREHSSVPEAERDAAFIGATRAQACDAARLALPTATTTTIGFFASGQALESLIMHLLSHELPEARAIGESLLAQARQVAPVFLERADRPDRGGALIAYRAHTAAKLAGLAQTYVPHTAPAKVAEPVTLTGYWPSNELDLVADMLYPYTDQPLVALQAAAKTWPRERQLEVFNSYMGERLNRRHRPGRAIERAHYSWDIVCDFGIFCDLQRHRMVDAQEWQQATPQYGYETPELVQEAGLSALFEDCFDTSRKLYDLLQGGGYGAEAQYATLLGHRMRWKVTYNARQAFHFHELRTSPQGHPGYRKLVRQMHEKLASVHPLLAQHMQFVNKDEDPELTRLAAERYTQFKLTQLRDPQAPA